MNMMESSGLPSDTELGPMDTNGKHMSKTVNWRLAQHRANIARFGEPRTLEELGHYVVSVIKHQGVPIVGLSWELVYTDRLVNSHSCPVRGVTNWQRDPKLPSHYSGWSGRVWVRYDTAGNRLHWGSDPFPRTQTHTSTGGWGTYDGPWESIARHRHLSKQSNISISDELKIYSFHYIVFEEDWPKISHWREQQEIVEILLGNNEPGHRHGFFWQDPETTLQDKQYLKMTG